MNKILIEEATVKLALEALENSWTEPGNKQYEFEKEAITALETELAKPDFWEGYVPEPDKRQQALDKKAENARELGLMPYNGGDYEPAPVAKPHEQEPVARQYQNRDGVWKDFISEKHYKDTLKDGSWPIRNLYTSLPAQRTWVGLTNEELRKFDVDPIEAKLMIAKLKEKNT